MSYQDFYNAYVKRYVYKTKKSCQDDVIKLWNTAKQKFPKKEELIHHIQHEIDRLLREATERKVRSTLAFLQKVQINDHNIQHVESAVQDEVNNQQSGDQDLDDCPQPAGASKRKNQPLEISDDEDEAMSNTTPSNVRPTPAQDAMKKKIAKLHMELDLTERRKGSLIADGTEFDKACNLRREIETCEKKLKLKEKQRAYSLTHRKNKKQKIIELCSKNPDAAKSLTPRAGPGRPRLEVEQSELLKTISDLALFGASAEERRRCEIVRTVVKCDDQMCCSPRRSDLHMILHDRFLPPPYPITQIEGHLTIPDFKEHDGKSFAPFLIRQCVPIQPLNAFISTPYDLYCPSVRNDLEKRCCSSCGIYYASVTRAAEHRRAAHIIPAKQARMFCKVRPSRIVTRRANELLCASANGLEWLDQNEVEGADDFTENHMDMLIPIISLKTAHDSPWTELE
ncbi:hypothetical protein SFRURICE_017323 [Spodoptera frugiperda]|nr:hypothetical protein SFRURICE_017323 [Spodoptera frugiperda]